MARFEVHLPARYGNLGDVDPELLPMGPAVEVTGWVLTGDDAKREAAGSSLALLVPTGGGGRVVLTREWLQAMLIEALPLAEGGS